MSNIILNARGTLSEVPNDFSNHSKYIKNYYDFYNFNDKPLYLNYSHDTLNRLINIIYGSFDIKEYDVQVQNLADFLLINLKFEIDENTRNAITYAYDKFFHDGQTIKKFFGGDIIEHDLCGSFDRYASEHPQKQVMCKVENKINIDVNDYILSRGFIKKRITDEIYRQRFICAIDETLSTDLSIRTKIINIYNLIKK